MHQELRAAGALADEARFEVARRMTEVRLRVRAAAGRGFRYDQRIAASSNVMTAIERAAAGDPTLRCTGRGR